jgi:GT2 family glycosyltransferase
MTLVSIVILNWNGKRYLEKYLPSLVRYNTLPGAEIVVADNGSTDDSVLYLTSRWPQIRVITLGSNYGFTGGYNRSLEQLEAKYFLLLNTDIEVTEGWLEPLVELMESRDEVAACTPKIKDIHQKDRFEYAGAAGGYIDRYGYTFCRGRIFDHLEADRGQYDEPREVFWGSGACLMVRAQLYKEIGGLDDRFFAHMEEIDLCWRLKRKGYQIHAVPSSTIYHVGGGTLDRGNPLKTFLNFRNNLLLLHKNLPPWNRRRIIFTRMLLDAVSAIRFLVQGAFRDAFAVIRAHMAYYGMKKHYRGTKEWNKSAENNVIVSEMYMKSIVVDFFLKGIRRFEQLEQRSGEGGWSNHAQ